MANFIPNQQRGQGYIASVIQYMRVDLKPGANDVSGGCLLPTTLITDIWTQGTPTVTYVDNTGAVIDTAPKAGDFLAQYTQISVTNSSEEDAIYIIAFIQPAWQKDLDMPTPGINP